MLHPFPPPLLMQIALERHVKALSRLSQRLQHGLKRGNTLSKLRPIHVNKMGEARRHCRGYVPWKVLVMKAKPPARAQCRASIQPTSFSATYRGVSAFLSSICRPHIYQRPLPLPQGNSIKMYQGARYCLTLSASSPLHHRPLKHHSCSGI